MASEAAKEAARKELMRRRAQAELDRRRSSGYDLPRTAAGGMLEGIPVVGPALRSGADMISAGILAATGPETYQQARQQLSADRERLIRQNPGTNTASQIAGAIAGTAPMVAAAPAAFGAGAGSLLARSGASALSGGALGGADAAVRSGGDLGDTASGAMWGAGLGVAAPAVGALAGRAANAVTNRMRAPRGAAGMVGRAATADAIDDVPGRLAQMGDDAMIMDLGPNLQGQAEALASTPGPGQRIVRDAISQRGARAGERVTSATNRALGQNVNTIQLADDITAQQTAKARPLYDAAYSKPVNFTTDLEDLLKRPTMSRALQKARGLAADEGISSRQWFANIADDGAVTFQNTPNVRQLDLTKRALDDMISTAQRQGNGNEARIYTQLKNRLTGIIDADVPEYAQARAAYAGPAAVKDALEEGQKVFTNSVTPNELRTQMMRLSDSEREAFVQGARAQVADAMGTARNDALKARQMFQQGYNQEKLALLVGEDEAARLLQSLDAETTFARTRDMVTGNSRTASRLAAQRDIGATASGPGILEQAGNLQFGTAAARMADRAIGGVRSEAQERLQEQLAQALASRNTQFVTDAIRRTQEAARAGQISEQQARQLIQSVSLGSAQSR